MSATTWRWWSPRRWRRPSDAAELVDVDYEVLPAGRRYRQARGAGAPQVHDEAHATRSSNGSSATRTAADAAFTKAAHVTKLDIVNNRLVPNAIEPRAAIGDYDRGSRTLHALHDQPEPACRAAGASRPSSASRRRTSCASSRPMSAAASARRSSSMPRRWCASGPRSGSAAGRSNGPPTARESFLSDAHGRDHVTPRRAGFATTTARSGRCGSHHRQYGRLSFDFRLLGPDLSLRHAAVGPVRYPAIYCEVDAVYTNTAPVDAYRGAGRPEATYVVERLVETAAREIKIDPAEFRRQQLHHPVPASDAGHHGL